MGKVRKAIEFEKRNNLLILSYKPYTGETKWILEKIQETRTCSIRRDVFIVSKEEYLSGQIDDEEPPSIVEFSIGTKKEGSYWLLSKDVFSIKNEIYIHDSLELKEDTFIVYGFSIFLKLDGLLAGKAYIGGSHEDAMPVDDFDKLLKRFPNSYELSKYKEARISEEISSYFDLKKDYERDFSNYMKKKAPSNFQFVEDIYSYEIPKYNMLLKKLKSMLASPDQFKEGMWQQEILKIVLLMLPKYVSVLEEVTLKDYKKRIDLVLVDSTGHIDIVEIKKPTNEMLSTGQYRDNYLPRRGLSGTIMQVEKYIFYLNKYTNAKQITKKYREKLPEGLELKIINPSAMIITGRSRWLDDAQREDFEIIRRKYKNVMDIITYDDLVERLERIISYWEIEAAKHK